MILDTLMNIFRWSPWMKSHVPLYSPNDQIGSGSQLARSRVLFVCMLWRVSLGCHSGLTMVTGIPLGGCRPGTALTNIQQLGLEWINRSGEIAGHLIAVLLYNGRMQGTSIASLHCTVLGLPGPWHLSQMGVECRFHLRTKHLVTPASFEWLPVVFLDGDICLSSRSHYQTLSPKCPSSGLCLRVWFAYDLTCYEKVTTVTLLYLFH